MNQSELRSVMPTIGFAALLLVTALLLGFRVEPLAHLTLIESQSPHWVLLFMVGFTFAQLGFEFDADKQAYWHSYALAAVLGAGLAAGVTQAYGLPIVVVLLATLVGVLVAVAISRVVMEVRVLANFALAFWLILLVAAFAGSYVLNQYDSGWFASFNLFLLGDIRFAHVSSWLATSVLIALNIAVYVAKPWRHELNLVTLGALLAIAGPMFFLSWLIRRFNLVLTSHVTQPLVLGVLGGSLLCFLAAVGRYLLGGYAPPLGFFLVLLAIPFLLDWNRLRLQNTHPSGVRNLLELGMIVASVVIIVLVLLHLKSTVSAV